MQNGTLEELKSLQKEHKLILTSKHLTQCEKDYYTKALNSIKKDIQTGNYK